MNLRKQQVRVTINGREYLVEVQDLNSDPITAFVGDQEYQVRVEDTPSPEPAPVESKPVSVSMPAP